MEGFEYDVCLSFAGEQRPYVEEVARLLREHGIRIFYDEYERVALWGIDLQEHLDWVYRKAARYCVVFISADYARKAWTIHERRSALARAMLDSGTYILPTRFDDTELPGLRPTIAYVDLRTTAPIELVQMIARKLEQEPRATHYHTWPPRYGGQVWIWVRPVGAAVGVEHDIRLKWGPWHRRIVAELSESGLTLLSNKSSESDEAPCRVQVTPEAYATFGVGVVTDRPVRDINVGWTAEPV